MKDDNTHLQYEYLISNDYTKTKTVSTIKQYSMFQILLSTPNRYALANNYGFAIINNITISNYYYYD